MACVISFLGWLDNTIVAPLNAFLRPLSCYVGATKKRHQALFDNVTIYSIASQQEGFLVYDEVAPLHPKAVGHRR